jgi:hypothetical protein
MICFRTHSDPPYRVAALSNRWNRQNHHVLMGQMVDGPPSGCLGGGAASTSLARSPINVARATRAACSAELPDIAPDACRPVMESRRLGEARVGESCRR